MNQNFDILTAQYADDILIFVRNSFDLKRKLKAFEGSCNTVKLENEY